MSPSNTKIIFAVLVTKNGRAEFKRLTTKPNIIKQGRVSHPPSSLVHNIRYNLAVSRFIIAWSKCVQECPTFSHESRALGALHTTMVTWIIHSGVVAFCRRHCIKRLASHQPQDVPLFCVMLAI